MLLVGSASAAYICPTDMGASHARALQADCTDNDQPVLCAAYVRGSAGTTLQAEPPAGGDRSRPLSVAPESPFQDEANLRVTQRIAPSGGTVPIYLVTARLRP